MLRLFRFLKPYVIPLITVVVLVFLQSMSDLYLPTLMSDIVNIGIINGDVNYILKTGGFMLLIAAGGTACAVLSGFLSSQVAMGFGKIIRGKLFRHVMSFSLREFDLVSTPSLITRNTNDVTQVQNVTMVIMRMMIMAPITCAGGIVMALSKDRALAWVIFAVIPILVTTILIIVRIAFPLFKSVQLKIDRINQVLREGLTGIRVIRAFDRNEQEKARFGQANLELTDISVKVNQMLAVLMPLMMLMMNLTTIAIIWFGSINVEHNVTNIGNMMAFLQYAMQIMFSLLMASMMFIMLPRAQASAMRINEVLDIAPAIKNPELHSETGTKKGYIEFRNVSFYYHGAEAPAVCNISFAACPGEVTAIIGSTGSGKTTLLNLIPRFYDVNEGSIEIDGIDIRKMDLGVLRSKIGYVPQKAVLFSGTISENIRFGEDSETDNTATDDDVRRAADTAQATEFISTMKDGFESVIAQGGTNVSGGQKQRLSIARALAVKPEIYLFDDSFSALDFKTDAKLRTALRRETSDATVIIVGQRVATIMDADRIIVLDDGEIAGMGTHRELYASCNIYREIVFSQLSEEEVV